MVSGGFGYRLYMDGVYSVLMCVGGRLNVLMLFSCIVYLIENLFFGK